VSLLRKRSLQTILGENDFRRISFSGLTKDFPYHLALMIEGYKHFEAYEMLDIIENQAELMDKLFMIYYHGSEGPIVMEEKDNYDQQDYDEIFKIARINVPVEQLQGFLDINKI
jgi:hypothetical protein